MPVHKTVYQGIKGAHPSSDGTPTAKMTAKIAREEYELCNSVSEGVATSAHAYFP